VKFLLTSSGISNPSIRDALLDLLGKPIAESSALIVPTGIYPFPNGSHMAWAAISGKAPSPFA
jgi:dipeptidase E